MTPFDLFTMRFALASGACLAAGLGVWGVTALARRFLPGFALQRSGWLLGQCVIAATFGLVLLPQTGQLRMVPAIELAEPHADVVQVAPAIAVSDPAPAPTSERSLMLDAAYAWVLIYLAGLAYSLLRLTHGQLIVARLVRSGTLLAQNAPHPGLQSRPAPVPVIEVTAAISPMLVGPFKPRLLLPLHLRSFDPVQQQLIVEHELTHWRRGDLRWMTAALALQTLFWFHPVMRLLRARLSWAQELACDSAVLQGRAPVQRKAYAAALLAQLKLQHLPVHMTLAFGGAGSDTLAARIALIRSPRQAARNAWTRGIVLSGLAIIFVVNLALQPALAWHGDAPTDIDCTALVDARTGTPLLRQGNCGQRVTPASTFNIVVSLMGFDSGILRDAHTPLLPFKQGYVDWNENWREATDPTSWIRNSTVWYAQQVTTQLGAARLAQYLARFDYGNRDASGDPGQDNGVTASWIGSSMQISPDEQTAFLRKIVNRALPVSPRAYDVTAQLLQLPDAAGWHVYGKTGTASPLLVNGSEDKVHQYGWFVGWATKGDRTVVFARLLLDQKQADRAAGPRVKAAFLHALPARLAAL